MSAGDAYARVKLQRFLAAFTQSLQTGRAVSKVLMSVIELQKWRTGGGVGGWGGETDRHRDRDETERRTQRDRGRQKDRDRDRKRDRERQKKEDIQQFVQALCSHRLLAVHCSSRRCV